MPVTIHFLLVYSYGEQRLIEKREFTNPDEAAAAYRAAEESNRGRSDEFEVVLVGADSLATVERTHGHYFLAPSDESAFGDLLTVK